jgi:putative endonuclease
MNCSYVLLSQKDRKFYIGSAGDLKKRVREHDQGRVRSIAYRRPLQLIYYEGCLNAEDARRRERYLKSGRGGQYLRQRMASWLSEIRNNKLDRR